MAPAPVRFTGPGPRSELRPLPQGMEGGVRRDGPEDAYQPLLWRNWSANGGFALWIGATQGTATAEADDAVTRREVAHTRRAWPSLGGYRRMSVSDLREAGPGALGRATLPLRSPALLELMEDYAQEAERIVLAFGEPPPVLARMVEDAVAVLRRTERDLWCLGTLRSGAPCGVLGVPARASAVPWPAPERARPDTASKLSGQGR